MKPLTDTQKRMQRHALLYGRRHGELECCRCKKTKPLKKFNMDEAPAEPMCRKCRKKHEKSMDRLIGMGAEFDGMDESPAATVQAVKEARDELKGDRLN